MRITVYVGPPKAGGDAVRTHLLENEAILSQEDVYLRIGPKHGAMLAKHMKAKKTPDEYIAALGVPETAKTVILWDEGLLGRLDRPFGKRFWYGTARNRMEGFHTYFEGYDVRTVMPLRDPATLIPAIFAENLRQRTLNDFKSFVGQTPLDKMLWSELIERVQLRDEYKPLLSWAFEDYPVIWRDALAAMAGINNPQILVGSLPVPDLEITVPQGEYYLDGARKLAEEGEKIQDEHWPMFLDLLPELTGLLEHPNWTAELQETLSEIYDEDLYSAARMDAVHFIEPRPEF